MSRKDAILNMRQILVKRRDALRKALAGDLSLLKELRARPPATWSTRPSTRSRTRSARNWPRSRAANLTRIEYALERMREGQFGICEGCGTNIPMARLNALPYATYCITCQREAERQGASFGRRRRLEPAAGFVRRRRRPVDQRHRAWTSRKLDLVRRGGYTERYADLCQTPTHGCQQGELRESRKPCVFIVGPWLPFFTSPLADFLPSPLCAGSWLALLLAVGPYSRRPAALSGLARGAGTAGGDHAGAARRIAAGIGTQHSRCSKPNRRW